MKWFSKMERKFSRFAIPNLMYYVIILYAAGFILELVRPGFYNYYLSLNANAILQGQVWRIVTFLMEPLDSSPIFIFFALYLYYIIGKQLEFVWGAFRFNFYFFMGVIFHIVAAFLAYFISGFSWPIGTMYLNLSLFFAYAAVYPDQQLYLFFVIPIKMKWLALVNGALFGWSIVQVFLPGRGGLVNQAVALQALVSVMNFVVFFFFTRKSKGVSPKEMYRKQRYHREVHQAKNERQTHNGAMHKCAVCGRTELDDPNLEFRYCSKCNGNYEYCQDHLFTHEHVK